MRQIIAMGGGGYSSPEDMALNRYVVEQCAVARPSVCLLAQAGGEHPEWIDKFHSAFGSLGCDTSTLSLFFPHTSEIESYLLSHDLIFVSGGNTKSLLALWREWGVDPILRKAWEQGTILAGMSAGANCWFEQGLTDSIPGTLGPLSGIGLLPGSFCPHYDSEESRRSTYQRMIASGDLMAGYAADDYVAVHFADNELQRAVTSVEGSGAYSVVRYEGETRLEVELLQ